MPTCSSYPVQDLKLQFDNTSGTFYIFFGSSFDNNQFTYFNSICSYSLKQQQWKLVTQDQYPSLTSGGSCLINKTLYYFLGLDENGEISDKIYSYDLTLNNGTKIIYDLIGGLHSFGYRCPNEQSFNLIIAGGYNQSEIQNKIYIIDFYNINNLTIYPSFAYPPQRYGASFSTVSDFSILFGGRDEVKFYPDLWKYQFIVDEKDNVYDLWTLLNAQGTYPEARAGHSASAQGNYIIIVGGYDANDNILSDYWLLETTQMKWTQIIPNPNSVTPPPLTNACVVLDLPYFYIIGGRTITGLTYDFWQYNFTDNQFYLRRSTDVHTDILLFKHSCSLSIENDNK